MQLNSNTAHAFPYYQTVSFGSDLTEYDEEILEVITEHLPKPIMAKRIASRLSIKNKSTYSRRDINRRLFKTLSKYVTQDEYFRWSLRYRGLEYPPQEDPEKEQYVEDDDVVNLDSTTKIKYFNGKELKIKFTKINSSRSNGPQADITYVYYKLPLAQALLTKRAGDVCYFPGGQCEVLEFD
jgi:hypothetical protein